MKACEVMDGAHFTDCQVLSILRSAYELRWINSTRGKWEKFPWWGDPLGEVSPCEDFSIANRRRAIKSQRLIPAARTSQVRDDEVLLAGTDVRQILGYHKTWRGRGLFYQRFLPAVYVQTDTRRLHFRLDDLITAIAALQINSSAAYRKRGNIAAARLLDYIDDFSPSESGKTKFQRSI